jgi:uncharacterized protein (DUF2236 family)
MIRPTMNERITSVAVRSLRATPLANALDTLLNKALRADVLPGVQFTEPPGDPGWFGADSAIWYVHSHLSAGLGGFAGLWMEASHPVLARALTEHSMLYQRGADWRISLGRLGQSASFTNAVTFGSVEVAEQASKIVRAMHGRVTGTAPDGRRYAADDPDLLCFAYANLSYGIATAHRRYHPAPLNDEDLDRFFADWAVIAATLGAVDVPTSRRGVEDYFKETVPTLAITDDGLRVLSTFEGTGLDGRARALWAPIRWIGADLLPEWARRLYRYPEVPAPARQALRAVVRTAVIGAHDAVGGSAEHLQALARVATGSHDSMAVTKST